MEIRIKTNALGELYLQDAEGRITRLYRFREALALAHITATTYYTWVKRGLIADAHLRDRGQWRVFTEPELRALIQLSCQLAETGGIWQQPPPPRAINWRESP